MVFRNVCPNYYAYRGILSNGFLRWRDITSPCWNSSCQYVPPDSSLHLYWLLQLLSSGLSAQCILLSRSSYNLVPLEGNKIRPQGLGFPWFYYCTVDTLGTELEDAYHVGILAIANGTVPYGTSMEIFYSLLNPSPHCWPSSWTGCSRILVSLLN